LKPKPTARLQKAALKPQPKYGTTSSQKTPWLHRVPLVGWLFQTNTSAEDQDELLIFITPKILK